MTAQNPRLGKTYRGASCQYLSEECGNNLFCLHGGVCVSGGCDCLGGYRWGAHHAALLRCVANAGSGLSGRRLTMHSRWFGSE